MLHPLTFSQPPPNIHHSSPSRNFSASPSDLIHTIPVIQSFNFFFPSKLPTKIPKTTVISCLSQIFRHLYLILSIESRPFKFFGSLCSFSQPPFFVSRHDTSTFYSSCFRFFHQKSNHKTQCISSLAIHCFISLVYSVHIHPPIHSATPIRKFTTGSTPTSSLPAKIFWVVDDLRFRNCSLDKSNHILHTLRLSRYQLCDSQKSRTRHRCSQICREASVLDERESS